jgi:tetratricopeptide (TPR) repeat protein
VRWVSVRGSERKTCVVLAVALLLMMNAHGADGQVLQPGLSGPANSPAPLANARRLMESGRFKEAEAALRSYITTDSRSGPARYMLAYTLLRQNEPKQSLEEYTRAAAVQTPSAEDLKNVGQAYVLLDDYTDAGKWMSRAVEMDGNDPEIWYSLGRLRYSEQKYPEAAECFQRTLAQGPKSVKAENNLGLAYEGLNRPDDAVAAYRQAIAWMDADAAEKKSEQPLLNLAIVLLHRQEASEAQALLTRAVAIAPEDPRIREQLGQLFMQQGNYAEAEKHLSEATRLDPGKSNLHFLLGQAYKHLGRQQEAKTEFDAASRLANVSADGKSD